MTLGPDEQLWADLGDALLRTKADFDPTTASARAARQLSQVAAWRSTARTP